MADKMEKIDELHRLKVNGYGNNPQIRRDDIDGQEEHMCTISEPKRTDGGKEYGATSNRGFIPTDDFAVLKDGHSHSKPSISKSRFGRNMEGKLR